MTAGRGGGTPTAVAESPTVLVLDEPAAGTDLFDRLSVGHLLGVRYLLPKSTDPEAHRRLASAGYETRRLRRFDPLRTPWREVVAARRPEYLPVEPTPASLFGPGERGSSVVPARGGEESGGDGRGLLGRVSGSDGDDRESDRPTPAEAARDWLVGLGVVAVLVVGFGAAVAGLGSVPAGAPGAVDVPLGPSGVVVTVVLLVVTAVVRSGPLVLLTPVAVAIAVLSLVIGWLVGSASRVVAALAVAAALVAAGAASLPTRPLGVSWQILLLAAAVVPYLLIVSLDAFVDPE